MSSIIPDSLGHNGPRSVCVDDRDVSLGPADTPGKISDCPRSLGGGMGRQERVVRAWVSVCSVYLPCVLGHIDVCKPRCPHLYNDGDASNFLGSGGLRGQVPS